MPHPIPDPLPITPIIRKNRKRTSNCSPKINERNNNWKKRGEGQGNITREISAVAGQLW